MTDEVKTKWVKAQEAAKFYRISIPQLRKWGRENSIPVERTPGGHFLYSLPVDDGSQEKQKEPSTWSENIIYARVSSRKQKGDLERQIRYLQLKHPSFTIVRDIGSGINYKRKGFKNILERLFKGGIKKVVVAHQDRFVRFGYDFFEWLFIQFGAVLECMEKQKALTRDDIIDDVMEVFTVFTSRYYGQRKYHQREQDDNGRDETPEGNQEVSSLPQSSPTETIP